MAGGIVEAPTGAMAVLSPAAFATPLGTSLALQHSSSAEGQVNNEDRMEGEEKTRNVIPQEEKENTTIEGKKE